MKKDELGRAIRRKYINPLHRKPTDTCGIEFELPIVNLDRKPADFEMIHRMTESFMTAFHFKEVARDDEGNLYSICSPENGDDLSFDCSYNTLEFSFGKESDLKVLNRRFRLYYMWVQEYLDRSHHTLTGMGLNPYRKYIRKDPIASERYRMLLHHLQSYPKYGDLMTFHEYPEYGLFTAANQIQMDVDEKTAPKVINTFARLEPLKALLLANSWLPEEPSRLLNRDRFWRDSTHGINPRNVGMPEEFFRNIDDVSEYIRGMSLYCVMREGRYIHFSPMPLDEYLSKKEITGEAYNADTDDFEEVTFRPEVKDLAFLRSFTFEDLTYRGTVEFRSVCEQPVSEIFASPALHAGLMEEVDGLAAILWSDDANRALFGHGYTPAELREMCTYRTLPDWIDLRQISSLWKEILSLAEEGLEKRGYGEEHFLKPLYKRAETMTSPAREMVEGIEHGDTLQYWIKRRALLDVD